MNQLEYLQRRRVDKKSGERWTTSKDVKRILAAVSGGVSALGAREALAFNSQPLWPEVRNTPVTGRSGDFTSLTGTRGAEALPNEFAFTWSDTDQIAYRVEAKIDDGVNGSVVLKKLGMATMPNLRDSNNQRISVNNYLPLRTRDGWVRQISGGSLGFDRGQLKWPLRCGSSIRTLTLGADGNLKATWGTDWDYLRVSRFSPDLPDWCAAAVMNPDARENDAVQIGFSITTAPEVRLPSGNDLVVQSVQEPSRDRSQYYTYFMQDDNNGARYRHFRENPNGTWTLEAPMRRMDTSRPVGGLYRVQTPSGRNVVLVFLGEDQLPGPNNTVLPSVFALEETAPGELRNVQVIVDPATYPAADDDGDGRINAIDRCPEDANPVPVNLNNNDIEDACEKSCADSTTIDANGWRVCQPEPNAPFVRESPDQSHLLKSNRPIAIRNNTAEPGAGQEVRLIHTRKVGRPQTAPMRIRIPDGYAVGIQALDTTRLNGTAGMGRLEANPYVPGQSPSFGPATARTFNGGMATMQDFGVVVNGIIGLEGCDVVVRVSRAGMPVDYGPDAGPPDTGSITGDGGGGGDRGTMDGGGATDAGEATDSSLQAEDGGMSEITDSGEPSQADAPAGSLDAGPAQGPDGEIHTPLHPKDGCNCSVAVTPKNNLLHENGRDSSPLQMPDVGLAAGLGMIAWQIQRRVKRSLRRGPMSGK